MRAHEFLSEVSRRDVLKGLGAAGLAAAGVSAQAGPGGQHLPEPPTYRDGADVKFHQQAWARLPPNIKQQWQTRRADLIKRVQAIYARLLQQVPSQDRPRLQGVRLDVPVDRAIYGSAEANLNTKTLGIDLGTFWDLSDNALAYTIGHEIGHFVYGLVSSQIGSWKNLSGDQFRQALAKSRQQEIDADAYGARLAYRAGFNHRDAFAEFTEEAKAAKESDYDTHPTYQRRKQEFDSVIKSLTPQEQQQKLKQISHVMRGIQSLTTQGAQA